MGKYKNKFTLVLHPKRSWSTNSIEFDAYIKCKIYKFQIYVEYRSDVVRFVILKSKRVGECEM